MPNADIPRWLQDKNNKKSYNAAITPLPKKNGVCLFNMSLEDDDSFSISGDLFEIDDSREELYELFDAILDESRKVDDKNNRLGEPSGIKCSISYNQDTRKLIVDLPKERQQTHPSPNPQLPTSSESPYGPEVQADASHLSTSGKSMEGSSDADASDVTSEICVGVGVDDLAETKRNNLENLLKNSPLDELVYITKEDLLEKGSTWRADNRENQQLFGMEFCSINNRPFAVCEEWMYALPVGSGLNEAFQKYFPSRQTHGEETTQSSSGWPIEMNVYKERGKVSVSNGKIQQLKFGHKNVNPTLAKQITVQHSDNPDDIDSIKHMIVRSEIASSTEVDDRKLLGYENDNDSFRIEKKFDNDTWVLLPKSERSQQPPILIGWGNEAAETAEQLQNQNNSRRAGRRGG